MTKHNSIVSMGEYGKPQRQRKSNQNSLTNFIENTGMLSSHQASAISYRSSLVLLPLQYMPSLLHLCLYLGVIKIQINVARCECVCVCVCGRKFTLNFRPWLDTEQHSLIPNVTNHFWLKSYIQNCLQLSFYIEIFSFARQFWITFFNRTCPSLLFMPNFMFSLLSDPWWGGGGEVPGHMYKQQSTLYTQICMFETIWIITFL